MKKNIFILAFLSVFGFVSAQTEYDALRLSQTDIVGSARYMSMGGAFGALGGDASALKDNPAGLGVFRKSEAAGTLDLSINTFSPITWFNMQNNQESSTKLSFNNFSYIVAVPTGNEDGLLSSNISITYHKLKDYNKKFYINGNASPGSFIDYLINFSNGKQGDISYDNYNMPWLTVLGYDGHLIDPIDNSLNFSTFLGLGELVDPSYEMIQTGSLSEYSFGWGGNFNSKLFIGANLNIRSLNYSLNSYFTEYFEGGNYELKNVLTQDGIGFNAKIGMIYLPTNNLRLGLSFHTPTFSSIAESGYADLRSTEIPTNEPNPAETPYNNQGFNLWSPLQAQASAAYLFGKKGLISAEYDFINYTAARFSKNSNSVHNFADVNLEMGKVLNNVHSLKLGAEAKLTQNVALRAGYSLMTAANNSTYENGKLLVPNSVNTNTEYFNQNYTANFVSAGLGYRTADWYIDASYTLRTQKEDFYPYQDEILKPAVLDGKRHSIAVTLGFKF